MAFTYDLSSSDANEVLVSKIRLAVGDTAESNGILPNGRNFQDEELLHFNSIEGDHLQRATAATLESAANAWSSRAGSYKLGPEAESSQQAAAFSERAQKLRDQYGYGSGEAQAGAFSVPVRPAGGS